MLFNKTRNLAGALADQANDDDIRLGPVRDHVEQHRFADPRSGHDADALANATSSERIERTHPGVEHLMHRAAIERAGADAARWPFVAGVDRAESVDRQALAIDRAAKKCLAHRQQPGTSLGPHPRAGAQHDRIAQQHCQGAAIAEPDDFGGKCDIAPV